ncbi:flagellar export chaperone FlgN [Thiomicrorhabdus aquaedulcis]|uniref:flagellar export chaperone FlgN n=1 Tax=Thiomicrorhabdus aquaedulcis TaxID=2211106 RepID=UPI000FDA7011|nr:flagellar export chaperone FlgN [Thiomicrorhabdus aquaedulcis]
MNSNTAITLLDVFTSQIGQLKSALLEFKAVLDVEAQALKQINNIEKILHILKSKEQLQQQLAKQLSSLELCISPPMPVTQLLSDSIWPTLPTTLQQDLLQIEQLTQACFNLNAANGISIQILSTLNQHTLNLISGKSATQVNLYDAAGESKSTSSQQTTLGQA